MEEYMTEDPTPIEQAHSVLVNHLLERDARAPAHNGLISSVAIGFPPDLTTERESLMIFVDMSAPGCSEECIREDAAGLVSPFEPVIIRTGAFEGLQGKPGVSIAPVDPPRYNIPEIAAGTFGLVAAAAPGGKQYAVSSNHVLANNGRTIAATNIREPGLTDEVDGGAVIASSTGCVRLKPPLWPLRGSAAARNLADCAWSELKSPVSPLPPEVISPGAPIACGTPVSKLGRTSGPSQSRISFRRWHGFIDFSFGTYYFADQLVTYDHAGADPFAAPGDSGSAVLRANTQFGVGLVCARGYHYDLNQNFRGYLIVISPFDAVLQELRSALNDVRVYGN
jgi:hypothetical protein